MRLFYFLLFIPALSFAGIPNCDETDLIAGTPGCSSLTIDQDMLLAGNGSATPLEITVNGNVNISANIILDGANGVHIIVGNENGKNGGPGGWPGGGINGNNAEPGLIPPEGGFQGQVEASCSSGGGGGASQVNNGDQGGLCDTGTVNGIPGTTLSNFPGVLSGGSGGGAGGEKLVVADFDLGGGGGGGGGIRIHAQGGTITIADGVIISAKGGNGGNSVNIGGAGGGGGGGTIHLIGDISIVNQGIFDVTGGQGGKARTAIPHGGDGGKGGNGIIRFEDGVNPPQDFFGRQDFSTGLSASSRSSLKSDISCGTVAKKNNDSMIFQLIVGFMLVMILKILFPIRKKIS